MIQYDAIIIGFGKGGKTLAADLASRHQQVAVVERSDQMYGGTCINIGCIPTKSLVHDAKQAARFLHSTFEEKKVYYRQAILRKNEVTKSLRQKNYEKLADQENITIYTGMASFTSPNTVVVTSDREKIQLQAKKIFINTGAETILPPIEGISGNPFVYTSTTLMEQTELPRRLVIVGGGYIGLEFASMYASFGSQVTVLEGNDQLIPREDRDIAAAVQSALEKKGIIFRMNSRVLNIDRNNNQAVVNYENTADHRLFKIEADAVLLATGRRPYTTGLNPEVAGVKINERGAVITDKYLHTTNPDIYAIGDVKGGLQFTYISLDDYRIIRDNLFGQEKRHTGDREPVSYSVFIDPPLSRIGMNEEEAKAAGKEIRIHKLPVAAIPRARTLGETEGILKAITDSQTHQILGCTLFCPESSEIINTVALAMKTNQDYTVLRDFIFTHPSMSEALNDLFA